MGQWNLALGADGQLALENAPAHKQLPLLLLSFLRLPLGKRALRVKLARTVVVCTESCGNVVRHPRTFGWLNINHEDARHVKVDFATAFAAR